MPSSSTFEAGRAKNTTGRGHSSQGNTPLSATDRCQHVGDGTALNLSESGCKLYSAHLLPIGSFWDLDLTIPETLHPVLISEVRVVWAAENECGIGFLHGTARERTRLRQFLWKHINRSTLRDGPPLFTLVDQSSLGML